MARLSKVLLQRFEQNGGQARFRQVLVDARCQGLPPRRIEGMAGQGDDRNRLRGGVALEAARHLPAIHPGQAEVEHDQIGHESTSLRQSVESGLRDRGPHAVVREELRVDVKVVLDVVDQEDQRALIAHVGGRQDASNLSRAHVR